MIDRDFRAGPVILRCDFCAGGFIETGEKELRPALKAARAEGWAVRWQSGPTVRGKRPGGAPGGWVHVCPDCEGPEL